VRFRSSQVSSVCFSLFMFRRCCVLLCAPSPPALRRGCCQRRSHYQVAAAPAGRRAHSARARLYHSHVHFERCGSLFAQGGARAAPLPNPTALSFFVRVRSCQNHFCPHHFCSNVYLPWHLLLWLLLGAGLPLPLPLHWQAGG